MDPIHGTSVRRGSQSTTLWGLDVPDIRHVMPRAVTRLVCDRVELTVTWKQTTLYPRACIHTHIHTHTHTNMAEKHAYMHKLHVQGYVCK